MTLFLLKDRATQHNFVFY